ncbi:polysaccharide deacetylase family protein [Micromonospora sp. GCM10011542]|uniref:polysaccharide deacetylase family protein n=1 Tax=Micromonospora sp. GCM10011542 TaxID=3317337 RepID=UPI003607798C
MTRVNSAPRAAGIVTLVVAALLGSAYALGRSLIPDQPRHHATGVTTGVDDPRYADQPSGEETSPGPQPNSDDGTGPSEAGQDGSTRRGSSPEPEADNLFGAHTTTGTSRVALTFDDGPDPRYTPQVLAALREHHVKATFCVVGENAQAHPDLIEAIVADGHTLCNHSWNHDVTLGKRSPEAIRADLVRTNDAIRAAAPGAPIVWYRQPGGAWTRPVVSVAQQLGMSPVHWSVDPSDWQAPGAGRVAAAVVTQVEPGSVVLLHDAGGDRQGTVDALARILPDLTSRFELEALPSDPT